MQSYQATLLSQHAHTHARSMRVATAHGTFETPTFMPVGTRAFVNLMMPSDLRAAGSQIILGGNTYHMLCYPGMETLEVVGGMHHFMNWHGPMLTDSGGFQVFSLSKDSQICKMDDQGAHFKHPVTGQVIHMTPEISIHAQKIIGADIIMAFDQCTPDAMTVSEAEFVMERTHRWLLQSIEAHRAQPCSTYGFPQALFGIVQGGAHRHLRETSTQFILETDVDGIAIGGESIGFNMPKTVEIIDWLRPMLPDNKLRYAMGVGLHPQDLIDVVKAGVDIFDCVAPTRNARHGALYHGIAESDGEWIRFNDFGEKRGQLLIKKTQYAREDKPILDGCTCHTCQHYSRAHLHYLFKMKAPMYALLACTHNIHVMHQVCTTMRECVHHAKK